MIHLNENSIKMTLTSRRCNTGLPVKGLKLDLSVSVPKAEKWTVKQTFQFWVSIQNGLHIHSMVSSGVYD